MPAVTAAPGLFEGWERVNVFLGILWKARVRKTMQKRSWGAHERPESSRSDEDL